LAKISGMKQQPSGIRVGQMRVPIGVFAHDFREPAQCHHRGGQPGIKSGNACILRGGSEAIESNKALALLVQQALRGQRPAARGRAAGADHRPRRVGSSSPCRSMWT
jgi:glutamate-5-semialdehyde dehydrogenase